MPAARERGSAGGGQGSKGRSGRPNLEALAGPDLEALATNPDEKCFFYKDPQV